jgi:L-alanine-DL-glutamate epimerase-like enolase superfamily enzyme
MVRIDEVELRRVAMPLVGPFTTSFGTQTDRDVLLLRVRTAEGVDGWGECVAMSAPWYSSEYVDGAAEVTRRFLLPPLLAADDVRAAEVARRLAGIVGHRKAGTGNGLSGVREGGFPEPLVSHGQGGSLRLGPAARSPPPGRSRPEGKRRPATRTG